MTYRKLAIAAAACTLIGAAAIFFLALGSTGDDDHPGGSCGWYAPNPAEPDAPALDSSGGPAADGSTG